MINLLLDVNVVVDYCLVKREGHLPVRDAIEKCLVNGGRLWLYVGSVQTLEYVLAKEVGRFLASQGRLLAPKAMRNLAKKLLARLAQRIHWLAALAGEGDVFASHDPEDEQLVHALTRFDGRIKLLTNDRELLRGCTYAITPAEFLELPDEATPTPFIDLGAQQDIIRPALEGNIHRVLHHGNYILGPEIKTLEERLAAFTGVRYAITCSSGTDALLMALMAYGVGPGDAIFTTPFTFIATAEVISLLGATPVFVDIDPGTFNLDPLKLALAIQAIKANDPSIYPLPNKNSPLATRHSPLLPRGIIAVDLFGLPAEYDRINATAAEHGLFIVEDAAQSFGAEYHGNRACSLADIACTSFFPAKPLGGYGDGGAVFTDDDSLAQAISSLRIHGKGVDQYHHIRIGINGRMDTLQAAILLTKLDIFPREVELRQRVAGQYTQKLAHLCPTLITPSIPEGLKSAWAQYSLLAKGQDQRERYQAMLKGAGIPTAIYYPLPLHLQMAFAHLGYREGDFPVCERDSRLIFSLPMHPYLTDKIVDRIADILSQVNLENGIQES